MQALVDKIFDNKSLTFAAAAIALLLALALILIIFRLAFGRRLKTPGNGRARLPRLGVVDSFDLDRQRQLVIVRRDNVEHLLMIGGPNDLVIEAQINRVEGREPRLRDKDLRESKEAPLAQGPVHHGPVVGAVPGQPLAPPWQPEPEPAYARIAAGPPPRKGGAAPIPSALAPEPEAAAPAPAADEPAIAPPAAADESAIAPTSAPFAAPFGAPARPAPAPRTPAFPLPPRRVVPPPPRPPREPLARPDLAARAEGAAPSGVFPRAPLATPFLRPMPPRQLAETMAKAAGLASSSAPPPSSPAAQPPAGAETPSGAASEEVDEPLATSPPSPSPVGAMDDPAAPPEQPAGLAPAPAVNGDAHADEIAKPAPAGENAALSPAFDAQDSLEEEMAKLLGRGPSR